MLILKTIVVSKAKTRKFVVDKNKMSHQVDWCTSADAGCVLALLQVSGNPSNRELQASLAGSGHLLLSSGTLAFAASRHFDDFY